MTRDHAKFIALFEVRGWACKTDEKSRMPSDRIMFAELVYNPATLQPETRAVMGPEMILAGCQCSVCRQERL